MSVMDDFVTDMHTKNGLLKEVLAAGCPTTNEADEMWAEFLRSHNDGDPKNILIVGNSIAKVDLPFIERHLPKSDQQTHYRSFDVTGLRIGAGIWYGNDTDFVKKKTHRAFDDIEECLAEFEYVAHEVFKPRE